MQLKITQTINTVSWNEGVANAPTDLVSRAKQLAEEGLPAVFGKVDGTNSWVVVSSDANNTLCINLRG